VEYWLAIKGDELLIHWMNLKNFMLSEKALVVDISGGEID